MSAIKTYFKEEVKASMLTLEHPKRSDFYLSGWQTTRSVVPLLFWRVILFLSAVTTVLFSVIVYILDGSFSYWFIYLTHWGLISILLATGFSVAVSVRIYIYGPISTEFTLPWYVKTYWVLYNIAVPTALMITIFYWTVLYEAGVAEELYDWLDVAVHGINSVIMVLLLLSSSQPSRLLHVYQPLFFAFLYMSFGLIYHFAGGTDPKGNTYIYPVVDWSSPGTTVLVCALTAVLLVLLHLFTMLLALARDALTSRYIKKSLIVHVEEGYPLRPSTQNVRP